MVHEHLKEQSLKLRKTNLIIGNPNPEQFITSNQRYLSEKKSMPILSRNLQKLAGKSANICLGSDFEQMTTESKH